MGHHATSTWSHHQSWSDPSVSGSAGSVASYQWLKSQSLCFRRNHMLHNWDSICSCFYSTFSRPLRTLEATDNVACQLFLLHAIENASFAPPVMSYNEMFSWGYCCLQRRVLLLPYGGMYRFYGWLPGLLPALSC